MSVNQYPPVFTPNPANERVPGSTPLLPAPYSSSVQAQPGTPSQSSGFVTSAQYNAAMAQVQQLINSSNAFDREKFVAQYQDLQKARDNAIQLENLRDQTSRYGYDQTRAAQQASLEENARQYDQTHALDIQKFGLDTQRLGLDAAKTYTDYGATPDKYFQGSKYLNLAGRILSGQPGAAPANSIGTFTANTPADFAALAAGQPLPVAAGRTTDPSTYAATSAAAGGAGGDQRAAVLKKLVDAIPPSNTPGMDPNSWAVMQAAHAIYSTNLNPQQYQAIKSDPDTLGITRSAIANSGGNPDAWQAQQVRQGISQGSALSA